MIELPVIFESELREGLRPQSTGLASVNTVFLEDLAGMRVDEFGLEPQVLQRDPFNGLLPVDWPYPQIYRGADVSVIGQRAAVKLVTEASSMWSTSSLTLYDTTSPLTTKTVAEGGVWHHADAGHSWFMFNGSCVVFTTGLDTLVPQDQKYWINDSITINTGCVHKGRIIVGGLASDVWSETMQEILQQMRSSINNDVITGFDDIGSNYIMWSSPGGGDFPLWLFMPLQYPLSVRPTYDKFIERLKRGQLGWFPCTFRGTVLKVAELGDHLIAYGSDGINALTHSLGGEDIPAGYGLRSPVNNRLKWIGIYDRGSVGGNSSIQFFLDTQGVLWSLDSDLRLTRLGYEEYLLPFVSNEETVVMTYDDLLGDLFISSDQRSFQLTPKGMSKSNYRYSTFVNWAGKKYALLHVPDTNETLYASLRTSRFDLTGGDHKTITGVQVAHQGGGTVEVALQYKYNRTDSWQQTRWVRLNPSGNTMLRVQGLEFKLLVRASDPTTFSLERIIAMVQRPDRRFIRGPREGSRVARHASSNSS